MLKSPVAKNPMTQNEALNLLMMGNNAFLTGQAGSGKTHLLNKYVNFLKKNKVSVAITASTGIAATHLNGQTIHSWSGMGIKNTFSDKDFARILKNSKLTKQISGAKVLIIDEISMIHSYRLDLIDQITKRIRNNPVPFGGLQVILCGDFFQLPPIAEEGFSHSSFAYKADAWKELDLKICYLDEQHRQWDEDFLKILNDIRAGELSEYTYEALKSRLNKPLGTNIIPTKLYTHNTDVDTINNDHLTKIHEPQKIYQMQSVGDKKLVENLKKGCLAPEELILKVGAQVMFIKNNPKKGYINGTLGIVVGFDDEDGYPIVETTSKNQVVATPASWALEENEKVLAEISQIPLRLAWAITVHKSQGMSLDLAEIDLSKTFALGMGYVALSRVRSLAGIKLLGINQMAFMVNPEVQEMDIHLKNKSNGEVLELNNMEIGEVSARQKTFLDKLISKAN